MKKAHRFALAAAAFSVAANLNACSPTQDFEVSNNSNVCVYGPPPVIEEADTEKAADSDIPAPETVTDEESSTASVFNPSNNANMCVYGPPPEPIEKPVTPSESEDTE